MSESKTSGLYLIHYSFIFFLGFILFYLVLYSKLKFRFDQIYFLNYYFFHGLTTLPAPQLFPIFIGHSKYLSKYKTGLILYLYTKATFMAMNAY